MLKGNQKLINAMSGIILVVEIVFALSLNFSFSSRIALHQNKEFKFSKNQLDIMKAKVTKLMKDEAAVEKVIRPCGRKLHAFKAESDDPFANVEVKRILTAEVAKEVEKRLCDRRGCPNESGRNNLQQEDSFTALRCVHTPKFQTVERDHRALLNPADRMVLPYYISA